MAVPENRRKPDRKKLLHVLGATGNNLKEVSLELPVGLFTCITGVSGSGKSTLVNALLGEETATVKKRLDQGSASYRHAVERDA